MEYENKILTPIKAIRAKCLDCTNNQYTEIKECPMTECSLYPYRMGKRPKKDYDNQTVNEVAKIKKA